MEKLAKYREELELMKDAVLGVSRAEVDDMPEGTLLGAEPESSVHARKIALIDEEIELVEGLEESVDIVGRKDILERALDKII